MPEFHLRASDADRSAVADVLGGHLTAGRLTVEEYDERLTGAYAARTHGQLAELTADLPVVPEPAPVPPSGADDDQRSVRPGAWVRWAGTAVIVTTIWLVTCLTSSSWTYPWPLWVVGPWGAVLLAQSLGGDRPAGRDRRAG